jgi:hypothetical protein
VGAEAYAGAGAARARRYPARACYVLSPSRTQ